MIPVDFANRHSAHQTLRDRRRLHAAAEEPLNSGEHQRRMLLTEFRGGLVIGFVWGAGLGFFFWLLNLWVDMGGAS